LDCEEIALKGAANNAKAKIFEEYKNFNNKFRNTQTELLPLLKPDFPDGYYNMYKKIFFLYTIYIYDLIYKKVILV
jgi:hypothetical protein